MTSLVSPSPDLDHDLRRVQSEIASALREIRYGSIEIVIQDSRVVQIERREKVRLR
jgi:hypothetical protein